MSKKETLSIIHKIILLWFNFLQNFKSFNFSQMSVFYQGFETVICFFFVLLQSHVYNFKRFGRDEAALLHNCNVFNVIKTHISLTKQPRQV